LDFDREREGLTLSTHPKGGGMRSSKRHRPAYAALDLGTNNCRLLVARPSGPSFNVIDSFSRIIRLGEGLTQTGEISEPAIERAISCIRICEGKLRRWQVRRGRFVATEACRKAANCIEFLDRVNYETGIRLEIIDTEEEAALAARGCGPLLTASRDFGIVFDIGGGSTEIVWLGAKRGRPMRILDTISIPMGVVTASDWLKGREITQERYDVLKSDARMPLAAFDTRNGIIEKVRSGRVQMLGASGTVTTVAGIHKKLARYRRDAVDGTLLDFTEIDAVRAELFAIGAEGRRANACVGPERADLVLPGCAILDAIREQWPVGRLRVADRGVREGILLSLMADDRRRQR
jgi:exopolyphosphatase/guanosine-5'-triphosphate,3'-diphosphate pyrophosphatase